jgi:hypothetical protein
MKLCKRLRRKLFISTRISCVYLALIISEDFGFFFHRRANYSNRWMDNKRLQTIGRKEEILASWESFINETMSILVWGNQECLNLLFSLKITEVNDPIGSALRWTYALCFISFLLYFLPFFCLVDIFICGNIFFENYGIVSGKFPVEPLLRE